MSRLLESIKDVEAAREDAKRPSFMTQLFAGEPDFSLLSPFPAQSPEDKAIGDDLCAKVGDYLVGNVDPQEIERTGVIPRAVLDGLAGIGCFGMTIPREYGGLGLSQTNYNRVLTVVASYCNILALTLSAHQSIGVSRPVLMYGSEEQKRAWLPRIARGAISAFALTEPNVGSDPANMVTSAMLSAGGRHYVINGEKLWCTNGPIADVIILLAKVEGKVTAFIVEMDRPGIEVLHRCEFLGCRGIENGWIRFTNVTVPVGNVVGDVGKGLKIALSTLNTGRISLAGLCLGMAKQVGPPTIEWARQRQSFGKKIGFHELNTHKIARMAADIFAMEAVGLLVAGLIDHANADYRVESAVAKLFCSERLWQVVDAAMQIRGGRGYEKADSLQARGEAPVPIEQIFRDARLYLIGEGASEILKLFIAREVWDPHIKRATAMFGSTGLAKLGEAARVGRFYASWYARMIAPVPRDAGIDLVPGNPTVRRHLAYVRGTSRRLARNIFYQMVRHGTRLEQRQALVGRLADIGVDLFVITAASSYSTVVPGSAPLAAQVFDDARTRIEANFRALSGNRDASTTRVGLDVLGDVYPWIWEGGINAGERLAVLPLADGWREERQPASAPVPGADGEPASAGAG